MLMRHNHTARRQAHVALATLAREETAFVAGVADAARCTAAEAEPVCRARLMTELYAGLTRYAAAELAAQVLRGGLRRMSFN
jgi:hypothetical protein